MFGTILGGAINVLGNMIGQGRRKGAAKRYFRNRGQYEASKFVAENKGLAQNAYNARSAGATAAEANIENSQANAIGNLSRASTSASTLLAAAGGVQQNTNNSFADLAQKENMDKERRLGTLMSANQEMAQEDRLVFQDKVARAQEAAGIEGAAIQQTQNMFSDIGNAVIYGAGSWNPFQGSSNKLGGAGYHWAKDSLRTTSVSNG